MMLGKVHLKRILTNVDKAKEPLTFRAFSCKQFLNLWLALSDQVIIGYSDAGAFACNILSVKTPERRRHAESQI